MKLPVRVTQPGMGRHRTGGWAVWLPGLFWGHPCVLGAQISRPVWAVSGVVAGAEVVRTNS